jgi:hypothetical protein
VLDALFRKTGTVGEVMSALDGNGMLASPHGVSELLAGLVRRGLVSRSGSAYRITAAGQAAIRRRKAALPGLLAAREPLRAGRQISGPAGRPA